MAQTESSGAPWGLFWATARAKKRGNWMGLAWLVIAAFWIGGCAGVMVMVLMQMSGSLPAQSTHAPDVNRLP